MKAFKYLFLFASLLLLSNLLKAQNVDDYIDVVYLKNGSIIKGIILEEVPGQTVRIQTKDGSQYVYQTTEIEKYGRELKDAYTINPGIPMDSILKARVKLVKPRLDKSVLPIQQYYIKEKGYYGEICAVAFGADFGFRSYNGYKFGRFGFLAAAVGFEYMSPFNTYFGPIVDSYHDMSGYMFSLFSYKSPFCTLNLVYSGELGRRKARPYYQVEAGYGIILTPITQAPYYYLKYADEDYSLGHYQTKNHGGPMATLSFGVRIYKLKKMNIKLGLDAKFHSNFADALEPGFGYPYNSQSSFDGGIGLRFGIGF